jgi:hypothetical protein
MPAQSRQASSGSRLWLQGLLCGTLLAIAAPAALLAVVLGLPALLARLFERTPGHPMARNLALIAAAVTIPALAALWHAGHSWAACLDLLADLDRLAIAWAVQAGFWLAGELAPLAIRLALDAAAATQAVRLRARRAEYEQEWGLPPATPDLP